MLRLWRIAVDFFVGWRLLALKIALTAIIAGGAFLYVRHKILEWRDYQDLKQEIKMEKILDNIKNAPADRDSVLDSMRRGTF